MFRVRRRSSAGVALIALLAVSSEGAACRGRAPAERQRARVRVGTAFGPLSAPLTAEYRQTLTGLDVQSVVAPNSPDVIHAIESGAADFGVAFTSDSYSGYWAVQEHGASHVRGVALLQPLSEYLIVRSGSGIRQVSDLRGKVVAVGPPNSSSSTLGRLVLEAFDVNPATIKILSTRAAAASGLKDRSVDAVFLPGYVYPDEVLAPVMREGAYVVPIQGPAVDRLREQNPFVRLTTIPRNVLPGQDRILPTIGIDMMVVCRDEVDESVVYELTKQLFLAFPRLSGVEATLRFLNFEEAAATPIPLHPGAARYFRERELSR